MKARRSYSYGGSRQKLGSGHINSQFIRQLSRRQTPELPSCPRLSPHSTLVDSSGEFCAADRAAGRSVDPQGIQVSPSFFSGIASGISESDNLFSYRSLDRGSSTSSTAGAPASPSFFSPADAKGRLSAQFGPRMWGEGGGYSAMEASPERNWMGEAAERAGFASGRRMSTSSYFQTLFRVGESCESGESCERENDFLETDYGESDIAETSCLARRSPRISSSRRSPSFFSPSRAHLPPFPSAAYPPNSLFRFSRSRRLSESAVCVPAAPPAISPSASASTSAAASRPPSSSTRVTPVDPWQAETLSQQALADKGCPRDVSVTGGLMPVSSGASSDAGAAAGETRGSSRLESSFENLSLDSDEAGSSESSAAAVGTGQAQPALLRNSQFYPNSDEAGSSESSVAWEEQAMAAPRAAPTGREESSWTPYNEADSKMTSDIPFSPRQQLSRKFCRLLECWAGAKGSRGRGACARGCDRGRVGEDDGGGAGMGSRGRLKKWWGGV
ncbi:unnamed protein product [Closterium sp. NIES-64]|nr:unnamed protein product [Closterium sp. NIES-64]